MNLITIFIIIINFTLIINVVQIDLNYQRKFIDLIIDKVKENYRNAHRFIDDWWEKEILFK